MKADRHIAAIGRAMPKGWSIHLAWVRRGRPCVVASSNSLWGTMGADDNGTTWLMIHTIREARRLPAAKEAQS